VDVLRLVAVSANSRICTTHSPTRGISSEMREMGLTLPQDWNILSSLAQTSIVRRPLLLFLGRPLWEVVDGVRSLPAAQWHRCICRVVVPQQPQPDLAIRSAL
jgi:hypothetical protein